MSATSGGISIISFTSVIGVPAGIASASFTLKFSLTTGIIKKLLKITRNKKTKHNKIVMLAKSKLNSIETLMSQALTDSEITHEEFKAIIDEKQKYEQMKGIKNIKSSDEKVELSENSRNNKRNTQILKNNDVFMYIYKMFNITEEKWKKNSVEVIMLDGNKTNIEENTLQSTENKG